jgi:hypothetical protein
MTLYIPSFLLFSVVCRFRFSRFCELLCSQSVASILFVDVNRVNVAESLSCFLYGYLGISPFSIFFLAVYKLWLWNDFCQ